jgi:hypothetical protein
MPPLPTVAPDTDPASGFLGSSRAQSACSREFEQVSDALVALLVGPTLRATGRDPVVRRSPNRSIVQCGSVAITVAWLRGGSASIADGELLVIGWRGQVAPAVDPIPERRNPVTASPPTALWEDTLRPVAETAATWGWTPVPA